MYNVLLILLHRPFVADGHLYNTARSISVNSLLTCATAANQIVRLLRVYDRAFSVRRAPYLISYATYVSATILVRIAAKRSSSSDVHRSLSTCIAVLSINQETNWAARRAKTILESLMNRLSVGIPDIAADPQMYVLGADQQMPPATSEAVATARASGPDELKPDGFSPGLDIDAVIQSFVPATENYANVYFSSQTGHQVAPDDSNRQVGLAYQNPMDFGDGMLQENQQQPYAGWDNQFVPQGFQFDDLLFGFNGSMVDDF